MIDNLAAYCEFLETMPDAALLVGQNGRVTYANRMSAQMLGHAQGSLHGQPLSVLLPHGARLAHDRQMAAYFDAPRPRPMRTGQTFTALRADGSEMAVDIMLQPLQIGGVPMVLAAVRDISERVQLQSQLNAALERERSLANTDPLTGAANRRFFVVVMQREIDRLRRYGHTFSLCYIDLDNFKVINDQRGHSVGDQLLRELVTTMGAHLRASDLLARLGGDEFAMLLPETGRAGAIAKLKRVRLDVAELMKSRGWPVTLSVGILACREAPGDLDTLVHAADALMYRAKMAGKDSVVAADYPS